MYIGMNFVNGEWWSHRPDFSDINPATESEIGLFPQTDKKGVSEAVRAARQAFDSWRRVSRVARSDYFDALAQLIKRDHSKLVEAISLETGKNKNEAHAEVIESLHMIQVVAGSGRQPYGEVMGSEISTKDSHVIRKPKGVVAVISPWNFPLAIGSTWCSAPAIVEGNCVVHKPSELTPMIAQMAAKLYEEAGFPPGVYNLIHGAGHVGADLVRADVDCVLFTGSAKVGQIIRQHCASTWNKSSSCEMGSKSATIVFEDGDLNLAVDASIASAFKLSGQRCVSSGRILVQRSVFDKFRDAFVEKVAEIQQGPPNDGQLEGDGSYYGPIISKEQKQMVERYNQFVRDDADAEVLVDRADSDHHVSGYFLGPFVYQVEWANKAFLKEEVFGPHVALVPFNDLDDAIRIYNDTDYGLALGVITDDFRKHKEIQERCDTGMLYINGGSIGAESSLPFAGVKKSGHGWPSAAGTYEAVTHKLSVTVNYEEGKTTWAQGMK